MALFPPWPGSPAALPLKGGAAEGRFDSATVCADGRVIYVWTAGNVLNQCHYPTVQDLVEADNAAATAATAIPLDGGEIAPRATVWRHPTTGILYLFSSSRVGTLEARNKVWRSPSGNGESAPGVQDWVFHATIQTSTAIFGGSAWHDETFGTGEPTVTPTGRWLLPCTYLLYRDAFRSGVFSSDDEGLTWTVRANIGFYIIGGVYGDGFGRNIVKVGNSYYFGANGNVEGPKVAVSSDNGTTWTITELADGGYTAHFPIDVDGATLYRLRWPFGGPSTIQSGSNYLSMAGWTNVLTLTGWGNVPGSAILQRLDVANDVFMMNGRVLGSTYVNPDITPPDTIIDSVDINREDKIITFTFSATEPNCTFECSFDGSAYSSCTSPKTYTNLDYGSHTFSVRATDAAGNTDPTPAVEEAFLSNPTVYYFDRNTPTVFPGTLGCSQHVAYIQSKCNGPRLCELSDLTSVTYDRRLDDISEATVIIPISGDDDNPCCACLGDVEPWCHQLTIVREGDGVVWTGPIQKIIYGYNQIRIEAKDKLAWLQVRVNEVIIDEFVTNTTVDWTTIAAFVAEVAMADDDDSPCFLDSVLDLGDGLPDGTARQIVFPAFEGPMAYDDFLTVAEGVVDFTVVNNWLVLAGQKLPSKSIGTLRDEHILGEIEVTKDGTQQGNRWWVRYDGDDDCEEVCVPQTAPTPCPEPFHDCCPCPVFVEGELDDCYGLIERIISDAQEGVNADAARMVAQAYLDNSRFAPRRIEFPGGTRLSPDTPWKLNDMIPGQRIDVALSKLCFPIFESFKLQQVSVEDSADGEIISVGLTAQQSTAE